MTTPTPRTPVRPGRGLKAALDAALTAGDIKEGEIVYAKDEDRLYIVEGGVFVAAGGGSGAASIDDLTDVDTSTVAPTTGQVLTWVDASNQWEPANVPTGATVINDLTDVNTVTSPPADGQVLTWVNASGEWRPAPLRVTGTVPTAPSDTGTTGELRLDTNYFYACVATNTWKRMALSTWTPPDTTVSLLLRMNGTNGSTSFPDASTYAHTVTANGSAQVSTSTVKFGSGALQGVSGVGSTGYLSVPDHESLEFGSGNFTIELFVNFNSVASVQSLISKGYAGTANMSWALFRDASRGTLQLTVSTDGSGDTRKEVTWAPSTGVWYHVAVTRSSGSLRFFVDGTQVEGAIASSETYFNGGGQTRIGWAVNYGLDGFIDEVRLTKGVARYTSNFTAPTAEFPNPS